MSDEDEDREAIERRRAELIEQKLEPPQIPPRPLPATCLSMPEMRDRVPIEPQPPMPLPCLSPATRLLPRRPQEPARDRPLGVRIALGLMVGMAIGTVIGFALWYFVVR